ncbi:MAG: hypothetical protein R3C59_00960 [Planctomycetaceae bacterium]
MMITRITLASLVFVSLAALSPPAFSQTADKGAPPWGEFLRQFRRDRLLKKPFHMIPETEVNGLASKLRARELDIPNRIKSLKYLEQFHCATFPEARAMLVKVLLEDKWEPVRLQAAKSLQAMFEDCACRNNQEDEPSNREKRNALKFGSPDLDSAKHCLCCCDADTLNALAKVAYETKENGCCFEPSRRVRQAAVEAIRVCGIPCHYKPYVEGDEQGPPAYEYEEVEKDPGPPQKEDEGEVVPPLNKELTPVPAGEEPLAIPPLARFEPKPIERLNKICLVSLKQGQRATPNRRFASTYRGRVYYFASEAAQAEFARAPEDYAVAFGGCDPVHFVETQEVLEGRYLVLHEGRFYMFATEQNLEQFKADVARYTGGQNSTSELALANPSR